MRYTQLVVLASLLFGTSAFAVDFNRAKTFEDAFKASCRVSVSNARGTGTFVGQDKEKDRCVILTNYHVVTNNSNTTLDFWTNGERQSISGKVFARFYDAKKPYDFALIEVDPDELAKIAPPYVALGGKGAAPDNNSYILSAGCPKGRFVQAWKGKVLGYYSGSTVEFQPAPVPGQSGSGVISVVDGQLFLTAVLTWLIGPEGADSSKGGAIPIANLYDALRGGPTNAADTDGFSPIPPGAVECAIGRPYVVEFTRDDCPACEKAEADAEKIRKAGVSFVSYNTSTSIGKEKAKGRDITLAPTFIVYASDGKEMSRYTGAGNAEKIVRDVRNVEAAEELTAAMEAEENPQTVTQSLTNNLFNLDVELPLMKEEPAPTLGDFRNRTPVYENEDDYDDVGFFEDADACWRSRRGRIEPQEEPKQQEPPRYEAPKIDEGKLGDRIGGRLRDGLSNSINSQLDGALDSIERRLEKKADSKIAGIKAELKKQIIVTWDAIKWKLAVVAVCIVLFGAMLAQGAIEGVKAAWRWLTLAYEEETPAETEKTAVNINKGTKANAKKK